METKYQSELNDIHIGSIQERAILDFLLQQPQIPNQNDNIKSLTLSLEANTSKLKEGFGYYKMVTTTQHDLLKANAILDFCKELTVTEDFVQADKNVLEQNALLEMAKVVKNLVKKVVEKVS